MLCDNHERKQAVHDTFRRYPRTEEQAFGPNPWPMSGPYRRGSQALRHVIVGALAVIGTLALVVGVLAATIAR
jgi:hypothetical protein